MQFLDVMIRQAHPGDGHQRYETYEHKLDEARQYKDAERIGWPVLVDDVAGTVHQTYGSMADPTYLIDADGTVAFYEQWTHPPTLKQALDELLAKGDRGVVHGGIDRMPHLLGSMIGGWHGVSRGGVRGVVEYDLSIPTAGVMTYLGHLAKPVLAPVGLRAEPLPTPAKVGLAIAGLVVVALVGLAGRLARDVTPVDAWTRRKAR